MKKLILASLFVLSFLSLVSTVKADCVDQSGQYSEPCNSFSIVVDKTVGIPSTNTDPGSQSYVDNLSVSDPKFSPGQDVFFKIVVTNTSTTTLGGAQVKDTVPLYLTPVSGPGTFDSNSRTITWDAGFFNVNEAKTFYLTMQVVPQSSLPSDQSILCVTNQAEASSNTVVDDDSSQLCIQKQVSGVVTVPSTGPEFGLGLVALEMLGAASGIYLTKRK